jgi:hypothetical protein
MLALSLPTLGVIEASALLEPERTLFSLSTHPDVMPEHRLTEKHRRLLSYWKAKRGHRDVPRRSDIDPCDLGPVLPNILLWDRVDNDYRCRLAGTEVCHNMIGKLQGVLLSELPCPLMEQTQREFDAARDGGLAILVERTLHWLGRPLVYYRHLLLPLVNDQDERHMLVGVMTFHSMSDC